jgi:hypothetical protein
VTEVLEGLGNGGFDFEACVDGVEAVNADREVQRRADPKVQRSALG